MQDVATIKRKRCAATKPNGWQCPRFATDKGKTCRIHSGPSRGTAIKLHSHCSVVFPGTSVPEGVQVWQEMTEHILAYLKAFRTQYTEAQQRHLDVVHEALDNIIRETLTT